MVQVIFYDKLKSISLSITVKGNIIELLDWNLPYYICQVAVISFPEIN